ncbi:MAG: hypothetical protein K2H66_05490 [Oscillospiraceae bacterium]|nr:hypothetical protein [Oscillospiraceae bacterium]MDE6657850.1 hypothetical protein [Oscillospiraceae bacterium]
MKYFITEQQRKQRGGSGYFQFLKGQKNKIYKPVYWQEDSLLLYMDIADELKIYKIIPDFQYYGITIIDKSKWNMIQQNAKQESNAIQELIAELVPWVEDNFRDFDYFVICGI